MLLSLELCVEKWTEALLRRWRPWIVTCRATSSHSCWSQPISLYWFFDKAFIKTDIFFEPFFRITPLLPSHFLQPGVPITPIGWKRRRVLVASLLHRRSFFCFTLRFRLGSRWPRCILCLFIGVICSLFRSRSFWWLLLRYWLPNWCSLGFISCFFLIAWWMFSMSLLFFHSRLFVFCVFILSLSQIWLCLLALSLYKAWPRISSRSCLAVEFVAMSISDFAGSPRLSPQNRCLKSHRSSITTFPKQIIGKSMKVNQR